MTDPFADSLCPGCAAHRPIRGRNTTFIMCTALPDKYPRQPVLACPAFQPGPGQGHDCGGADDPAD
jgi:hypothetical protein